MQSCADTIESMIKVARSTKPTLWPPDDLNLLLPSKVLGTNEDVDGVV